MNAVLALVDRTTMYRLVLYWLLALVAAGALAGALGALSYGALPILASAAALAASCFIADYALAWYFGRARNHESALITALIIALIIPPAALGDTPGFIALGFIAVWAIASKYLITFRGKHVFNPAALAVALSASLISVPATWWVAGNDALLPFVILGGALVVYKLRRWDIVLSFLATAVIFSAATAPDPGSALLATLEHSSLFFLAFAMLTEPLTMPPSRGYRIAEGILVGVLFAPAAHLGTFYFSPEIALLVGNAYSFMVSPKGRYELMLTQVRKLAEGIFEFVFRPAHPFAFSAGQYLEWTLPRVPLDSRGNRRYFTIASAPEDASVALGVRFYDAPSAFKRTLAHLAPGAVVTAGNLAGDFMLPADAKTKLAFIAGGVGVTPFASMVRHMVASGERRDAILLYAARRRGDFAYADIFDKARTMGLRVGYIATDPPDAMTLDEGLIARSIPDYRERTFYVSGPPGMVRAVKKALAALGVSRFKVKTDYFPGLA